MAGQHPFLHESLLRGHREKAPAVGWTRGGRGHFIRILLALLLLLLLKGWIHSIPLRVFKVCLQEDTRPGGRRGLLTVL